MKQFVENNNLSPQKAAADMKCHMKRKRHTFYVLLKLSVQCFID